MKHDPNRTDSTLDNHHTGGIKIHRLWYLVHSLRVALIGNLFGMHVNLFDGKVIQNISFKKTSLNGKYVKRE